MQKEYIDKDNNIYELLPYKYHKGDHACVGCAFKFGNSNACKKAPTCTPKNNKYESLVKGRHVWIQKNS